MAQTPLLQLNRRLSHTICDLRAEGLGVADIADCLNISRRALYLWIQKGRLGDDDSGLCSELYDGLRAAEAERQEHIRQAVALARERVSPRARPPAAPTPRP
jgi:hypothetical protein